MMLCAAIAALTAAIVSVGWFGAREDAGSAMLASAPTVIGSLVVGLAVALSSATTQIQEATLSFVPKVIAVFLLLAITGAWVGGFLLQFAHLCFTGFVPLLR